MYHPEALEPIVDFVRSIGVAVHYGDAARDGFLPGINIHAGDLHIDPDALLGSGDILHEAGHIIGVPRRYWSRLGTDLQAGVDALLTEEREPDGGENPLPAQAALYGALDAGLSGDPATPFRRRRWSMRRGSATPAGRS
jgi:hypothetical protein